MRNRLSRAFTLVEILIVVVILGILAAIVVPQFTNASQDAQIGNVETQLATIRSQIELYRVRNNGNYPFDDNLNWDNLVDVDYLRAAPVNPRTGSSTLVAGEGHDDGSMNDGWVFDAATGNIYASLFDETNRVWIEEPE